MREVYLNITYECNSNCVFCAAEHEIVGQCGKMNFEEIVGVLEKIGLIKGDEVIINGGEPTIHKDLLRIIRYIKSKQADVVLFTNGRTFKNMPFLMEIYEQNLSQISIPIHGDEMTHDKITRVKGSYRETLEGISNLKKIKNSKKTSIELKVVLCKSNLEVITQAVERILQYEVADRILISALFQTEVANKNNEILTPNEIIPVVIDILNRIKKSSYEGNVVLYGIPLCIMGDEEIEFLIKRMESNSRFVGNQFEEIYIDYMKKGEYIKDFDNNKCLVSCCKLRNYCEIGDGSNYRMYLKLLNPFM